MRSAVHHTRVEEAVSLNFRKKRKKNFFCVFLTHKKRALNSKVDVSGKAMEEKKACYFTNDTSKSLETN